jgi:hypothetical protein
VLCVGNFEWVPCRRVFVLIVLNTISVCDVFTRQALSSGLVCVVVSASCRAPKKGEGLRTRAKIAGQNRDPQIFTTCVSAQAHTHSHTNTYAQPHSHTHTHTHTHTRTHTQTDTHTHKHTDTHRHTDTRSTHKKILARSTTQTNTNRGTIFAAAGTSTPGSLRAAVRAPRTAPPTTRRPGCASRCAPSSTASALQPAHASCRCAHEKGVCARAHACTAHPMSMRGAEQGAHRLAVHAVHYCRLTERLEAVQAAAVCEAENLDSHLRFRVVRRVDRASAQDTQTQTQTHTAPRRPI